MIYCPSDRILRKYAELLVHFALGGGKGIKKGDTIYIQAHEIARPLFDQIRIAIIRSGGHYISGYMPDYTTGKPDDVFPGFFELASEAQISHINKTYYRGLVKAVDHFLIILSDPYVGILEKTDPKKIVLRRKAFKPFMDWRNQKEYENKLTWTLALYATQSLADQSGMSLEEYWNHIIAACYLNEPDPISEWKRIFQQIEKIKKTLNELCINRLFIKGEKIDLTVQIGKGRVWLGGGGRNIPSYEVFTSPDWRGTEGYVEFDQPLFGYGKKIEGIRLEFRKGRVISYSARVNESLLKEIIEADSGSNAIGEFSLTDKRLSRVMKFMADTLYDENRGGEWGNMHIALGMAYKDAYGKNPSRASQSTWRKLGYNESVIHSDIVLTQPITVTAELPSGEMRVIYREGKFTL